MSYEKQTWEDLPSENTPVNAERMNHIEEGIAGVDTAKLDKMYIQKALDTVGWYRVAKYNGDGTKAVSFIVNINTLYRNTTNVSTTLAINIVNKNAKITNLSTNTLGDTISRVRLVQENSETYLEVYYNKSVLNTVYIDLLVQNAHAEYYLSMLDFEAPTDTATVLDELTIEETKEKLDKMVVSSYLNTAGWYRVAKYSNTGGTGKSFIVNINTAYNNVTNMSVTLVVQIIHNKARITNISSLTNEKVVSNIKVVTENNENYLEIYYGSSTSNYVYIDIINQDLVDGINLSMLNFEASTNTGTVLYTKQLYEFEDYIIPSADANFNDITNNGKYVFGSAPTGENKPSTITGILEVFATSSGTIVTQRYTLYTGAKMYIRGCYNGTWTAWTEY